MFFFSFFQSWAIKGGYRHGKKKKKLKKKKIKIMVLRGKINNFLIIDYVLLCSPRSIINITTFRELNENVELWRCSYFIFWSPNNS